jgi:phosphopantetheinyl transferase
MQVVESQTPILYHTDLRDEWPEAYAQALAARLPYAKRLAVSASSAAARASLAGIALALQALPQVLGRAVAAGELRFPQGQKPHLADGAADFSISHSGPLVACAAVCGGTVGLDLEMGSTTRIASWVQREAALKALGVGLRELPLLADLHWRDGRAHWRAREWFLRTLPHFPGAQACLVASVPLAALSAQQLTLTELFAS